MKVLEQKVRAVGGLGVQLVATRYEVPGVVTPKIDLEVRYSDSNGGHTTKKMFSPLSAKLVASTLIPLLSEIVEEELREMKVKADLERLKYIHSLPKACEPEVGEVVVKKMPRPGPKRTRPLRTS